MACNYDDSANYDDGSCTYPEEHYDCDNNFIGVNLQIIHNAASPTVDVYLNGELAIPGFEYRTATQVAHFSNTFTLGIAAAGQTELAYELEVELESGGSYVAVATGLLGDDLTPFEVVAAPTQYIASDNQSVWLQNYHGSTDAPTVDVWAGEAVLFEDFSYGDFVNVEVPAGDYIIGIAPADGERIAAFSAPLSGLGGGTAVAFASGFLNPDVGQPEFGLFAALQNGDVITLPPLTEDCSGTWGGDDYIVCEDGSQVCDEADCPTSSAIMIGFGEVTDSMLEITYDSNTDIAGFQFTVSGVTLLSADGGAAADSEFTVSVGGTTGIVIGFSFDGSTIPAGQGTLTNLMVENPDGSTESCLINAVVSDVNGESFADIMVGDCAEYPLNVFDDLPVVYSLSQNYPNPFNPTTSISFSVINSGEVSLKVYDLSGKEINELTDNFYTPGVYNVIWDATDFNGNLVSSGIYIYQLKSNDGILSNSMILMR